MPVLVVVASTIVKGRVRTATTTSVGLLLLAHAIAIAPVVGAAARPASTHHATWTATSHHVIGCASAELAKVA